MEETTQKPQGKGLAIVGFIISLLMIISIWFVWGAAAIVQAAGGNGYISLIVCFVIAIVGLLLSFMGMKKLGATGGGKGLAMTGLIINVVVVILLAYFMYTVSQVPSFETTLNDFGGELNDAMQQLNDSIQ
jgi:heme/copper-type cytochrome/quinol oxidase subunit 4